MKTQTVDDVYKELGKRIYEARKKRKMSQEDLADASDLDRSHVGYLEQGRRRPTLSTLYKIAKVLDMNLEQLFKGL